MDSLDARILLELDDDPDATALALARRLGVARNTLHARLQRLRTSGALREHSRRLDPAHLGRPLVAFVSIELSQASSAQATRALCAVPEVIEVHATTGDADLLLKVVARDTADLHRLTGVLLTVAGVVRMSTVVSLHEQMPLRLRLLLEELAGPSRPRSSADRETLDRPPAARDARRGAEPAQPEAPSAQEHAMSKDKGGRAAKKPKAAKNIKTGGQTPTQGAVTASTAKSK